MRYRTSGETTEARDPLEYQNGDEALTQAKLMMATGPTGPKALSLLYRAVNSLDISQEGLHEAVTLIRRYG